MYGPTRALNGVNVEFRAGEITVIEGPNGSGKSTLLSLVGQLAQPSSGRIFYGRRSGSGPRARRRLSHQIGILSHQSMLYPDLTGRENLRLFGELYGLDEVERRSHLVCERFGVTADFFDRPTRTYSRGQLQRVALARAVLHRPRLLLLDEPSTGLDRASTKLLEEAVATEKQNGTILLLVTHDPAFADAVADQRIRLHKGRVRATETVA